MKNKSEISRILFHYADFITIKKDGSDFICKGFIYRKNTDAEAKLYEGGLVGKKDEFAMVADKIDIRKGDIVNYGEKEFYVNEVSPLCIMDINQGVSAKITMLK